MLRVIWSDAGDMKGTLAFSLSSVGINLRMKAADLSKT